LRHLRVRLLSARDGKAEFQVVLRDFHLRTGGTVHGGVYATLMDAVTGYAAHTVMPAAHGMMTIQLNLHMTGTSKAGDRLIATAQTQHAGRTTAVALGQIRRADGKLLATGSATMLFMPIRPAPAARPQPPRERRRTIASRRLKSSSS
jgi:uncharacterized protein (TIGR00369 family)